MIGRANPEAYNKSTKEGRGTLVGNWFEEETLRRESGIARTQPQEHLSKNRDDLFLKPYEEIDLHSRRGDDTFYRTLGGNRCHGHTTSTSVIGEGLFVGGPSRPESAVGRRSQLMKKQMLADINKELEEMEVQKSLESNKRDFLSSNKANMAYLGPSPVPVGRRVMKTLDGKAISPESVDDNIFIEKGLKGRKGRRQINTDKEIRDMIVPGNYAQDIPITIYTEKINDGNFYGSKHSKGTPTPFGRNNEFLRNYKNYRHTKD